MKILIIHQYYLMPGQGGGSRFNEFARLWAEAGHEITVIAGNLSYVTGEVPTKYRGRWLTFATADKVVFVPNGANPDFFHPGERDNSVRREFAWGNRFVVMYAGQHGRANAVGQLLDTAGLLQDRSDVLIASVGDGPELSSLREEA